MCVCVCDRQEERKKIKKEKKREGIVLDKEHVDAVKTTSRIFDFLDSLLLFLTSFVPCSP